MKCPVCDKGKLKKTKVKEDIFGVHLGEFDGEVCNKCGETFLEEKEMIEVEKRAKEKGIWGLALTTKITKTGNSIAVRIPKKIADYLKIKEGREAQIHPEGKKLIIECKD